MITKKIIFIFIAIIIMVGIGFFLKGNSSKTLASPALSRVTDIQTSFPSPTPALPAPPKTFNFDSSADLETELERVNPQVLDSDFQ